MMRFVAPSAVSWSVTLPYSYSSCPPKSMKEEYLGNRYHIPDPATFLQFAQWQMCLLFSKLVGYVQCIGHRDVPSWLFSEEIIIVDFDLYGLAETGSFHIAFDLCQLTWFWVLWSSSFMRCCFDCSRCGFGVWRECGGILGILTPHHSDVSMLPFRLVAYYRLLPTSINLNEDIHVHRERVMTRDRRVYLQWLRGCVWIGAVCTHGYCVPMC